MKHTPKTYPSDGGKYCASAVLFQCLSWLGIHYHYKLNALADCYILWQNCVYNTWELAYFVNLFLHVTAECFSH